MELQFVTPEPLAVTGGLTGRLLSHLVRRVWPLLPVDAGIYTRCIQYVDRVNGDNNTDMYTNGEQHLLEALLPASRVVFDVGANVGSWAAAALRINPAIALHCFEPSRAAFGQLQARGLPGAVHLNNIALGDVAEIRPFYVFAPGSPLNSLYRRRGLEDGWNLPPPLASESVRIETIDEYCDRHAVPEVDLLKLDVEGHELSALKGGRRMLAEERIGAVQFEYGGCCIDAGTLLKDIFDFWEPLSYQLFKLFPDGPRPVARYDQRMENFKYQNWLAVRPANLAQLMR